MQTETVDNPYCRKKDQLFLVNLGITFLFLVVMMYSFSLPLRNMIGEITESSIIVIALYFLASYLFYFIFTFGLKYYEGFILKHKFELSRQSFKEWIRQLAKKEGFIFCLLLVFVQSTYLLMEMRPKSWWLWAGIFWVLFNILISEIYPHFISPLLYKCTLLVDEKLKQRLILLAAKSGMKIDEVYSLDPKVDIKIKNLILTNLGSVRRIILNSALRDYCAEEIEILLGRELAHHHYGHTKKLLILRSLGIFFVFFVVGLLFKPIAGMFGFRPVSDISSLPLLMLLIFVFSIFILIIQNNFNRKLEIEADEFTLDLTRLPDAFISVMIRLLGENLSDPAPSRFRERLLYNHPPLLKRIWMAEEYVHGLWFKKRQRRF